MKLAVQISSIKSAQLCVSNDDINIQRLQSHTQTEYVPSMDYTNTIEWEECGESVCHNRIDVNESTVSRCLLW